MSIQNTKGFYILLSIPIRAAQVDGPCSICADWFQELGEDFRRIISSIFTAELANTDRSKSSGAFQSSMMQMQQF